MRRAKFRKIGRGRFEVAVVTPHAALFEPAHLFQVQQPERRAKRNGHLGAEPAINRADPVGIGIGKRPTAGYQRKALHALACIAGRLFDRFPGSYQRIDLDFRFMKFRLSAPLAVLAATAAAGVHYRTHIDRFPLIARAQRMSQRAQFRFRSRSQQFQRFVVSQTIPLFDSLFQTTDRFHPILFACYLQRYYI